MSKLTSRSVLIASFIGYAVGMAMFAYSWDGKHINSLLAVGNLAAWTFVLFYACGTE